MSRVLLSPDKFRGSLTAPEAATAFARGVREAFPAAEVVLRPVADGGEGTVDAFVDSGWEAVAVRCAGPTGERVGARYARRGERAVVELAECCGMQRLPAGVTAPRTATSRGAGDALAAAVRAGAREVVFGVGGSASTDGGIGLLAALGVVVRDAHGAVLPPVPESLHHAATVDLDDVLPDLRGARIVIATDVTNPLVGPDGAAAVFGPQKGADPDDVAWLAAGLVHWATVLATVGPAVAELPGGGAAGGVPAGLVGALAGIADVTVVSGADTVVELVGVTAALTGCDLVLTGEGSFDRQSLAGKADDLRAAGIGHVRALTDLAGAGEDPMRDAAVLATRAAAQITRAALR